MVNTIKNKTETKFYNCFNDRVFKRMMQSRNGRKYLEAILKTILKTNCQIKEYLNVELPGETKDEKEKRIDLLVLTDQGYINIEINNNDYTEVKRLRNFIYLCNYYSQQVKTGDVYKTDINFIQINFNFGRSSSNKAFTTGKMINEDGEMFSNFSMMEINVENLKEMCYNNLELEEEYKYILMMDMEKEELANYSNSDPLIRKYEGDLVKINSDKKFVALLTAEEDARLLHNTELAMEYKKGIKEGIEQNKLDVIKNMLIKEMTIEDIADIVNLSMQEVEKIIKENNL